MTKELQKRGFKSWKQFDEMLEQVETSGRECVERAKKRIKELEHEQKEKDITIEFFSLLLKQLLKATNKKPHIEAGDSRDEYELWICDDSGKDIVVEMPELSHKLKELNVMIDNLPDNPHDT